MRRERQTKRFVDSLAEAELPNEKSSNIYLCATRRENLEQWLTSFADSSRSAIFVGEAPGIKGARITGVGFTSPAIITHQQPYLWDAFGPAGCYRIPVSENSAQKEQAATIFWSRVGRYFADLPRPLTWNAYPYWPGREGEKGNRTPDDFELEFGHRWLHDIVEIYPDSLVVAVGKQAKKAFETIGVKCCYVRHPSFGGAPEFEAGVKRIAEKLRRRRKRD